MTDRELMQQALEALEEIADEVFSPYDNKLGDAILALRAAIEHPRQWQGLTPSEITAIELSLRQYHDGDRYDLSLANFASAIESKLRERNT